MIEPCDILPALLLPGAVLLALAAYVPLEGGRASARRQAWARFEALARLRGLTPSERGLLARWASISLPDQPHLVLSRRQDFDRFARSEVKRLGRLDGDGRTRHLDWLGQLRRRLGFGPRGSRVLSTHDLRPQERLRVMFDGGGRIDLRVDAVDEAGLSLAQLGGRVVPGPAWFSFGRDGQGTYRFRAELRAGARPGSWRCTHGEFLVQEERRREPRISLALPPFWLAVERLPDGAAPDDPEGVEVELVDLSLGGVAVLADRLVRRGSVLGLDLPLGPDLEVCDLEARVLAQGFREGGGERPFFLNCSFEGLSPAQRRLLESFVEARLEMAA